MTIHRVGLIGCGWIAPFHVVGLGKLGSRAQIVWVADPVRDRAEDLARQAGARPLTDYREGLKEVDCAFVLVPHHLHHQITLDCLEAGCHVLLEKPMANSLAEADEMIAAAERAGKALMIAYPQRYRECVKVFRQTLLGGRYGRLFMLDALMDNYVLDYAVGWITKKKTLGGGIFFSQSTHMLDVMRWIAGEVQTISMVGTHGGNKHEGEDTAASVMKFQNGVIGVIRDTWASPRPRAWYQMRGVCEKAHVTLATNPVGDFGGEGVRCSYSTRIVALGEKEEVLLDSAEGLDLGPEIEHFFNCVETGQRPQTDGYTARRLIELVFQAYHKAEIEGGNT